MVGFVFFGECLNFKWTKISLEPGFQSYLCIHLHHTYLLPFKAKKKEVTYATSFLFILYALVFNTITFESPFGVNVPFSKKQ